MLEGEYLDMVNHLKSQFDEKDKESEKLRENYEFLKKTFLSVYGFIRIIDITDEYSDKECMILLAS